MNTEVRKIFLYRSPGNLSLLLEKFPEITHKEIMELPCKDHLHAGLESFVFITEKLSGQDLEEFLLHFSPLPEIHCEYIGKQFKPEEDFSFLNRTILKMYASLEKMPKEIPAKLASFITSKFEVQKFKKTSDNEDLFLILKCLFLTGKESFQQYIELNDDELPLMFRVEIFKSLSKLRKSGIMSEKIEELALRNLKPTQSFLLFKALCSCLSGSNNTLVINRFLNMLDLNPPYQQLVLSNLESFNYSGIENIISILNTMFANREITSDENKLFPLLVSMKRTNEGFDKKLPLLIKDLLKNKGKALPAPSDEQEKPLHEKLRIIFSRFPQKDLYNELVTLLKMKDSSVYIKVAEKYLKIVKDIPSELQGPFKEVLKVQNEREKTQLRQKIEQIDFRDFRYEFVGDLILLNTLEKVGNAEYEEVFNIFLETTANEHIIAKIIYLIGKFRIMDSMETVMGYLEYPSFTVRGNAIWALGETAPNSYMTLFISQLEDENEWIRLQALTALENTDNKMVISEVRSLLKREIFEPVREQAFKVVFSLKPEYSECREFIELTANRNEAFQFADAILSSRFTEEEKQKLADQLVGRFNELGPLFGKQEPGEYPDDPEFLHDFAELAPGSKAIEEIIKRFLSGHRDYKNVLYRLKENSGIRKAIDEKLQEL